MEREARLKLLEKADQCIEDLRKAMLLEEIQMRQADYIYYQFYRLARACGSTSFPKVERNVISTQGNAGLIQEYIDELQEQMKAEKEALTILYPVT